MIDVSTKKGHSIMCNTCVLYVCMYLYSSLCFVEILERFYRELPPYCSTISHNRVSAELTLGALAFRSNTELIH